ncbi:MAG: dihydrolipoyl dehydrogenase [Planctomycetes bacterium]|nr:dihydrolipoyl dehydrogenase [Planctomycetota bacterium]
MPERYDLVVIGAGPGGYVAAIRAAQLGLKAACVEKGKTLGGTCLNIGCIPSKALLESSELYHLAKSRFGRHGIAVKGVELDLPRMQGRKNDIVKSLTEGVAFLFRKNKIATVTGVGRIAGKGKVTVTGDQVTELEAGAILLATGSEPASLPFLPFDGKQVVSSTEALAFDKVPEHLIVIGGGYIGLELGSVWARLGSKVTVLEFLPRLLPLNDGEIAGLLHKSLAKQGLEFHLETRVTGAKKEAGKVTVQAEAPGKKLEFKGDKILVSVGRKPVTTGLGLEEAGVKLDPKTGKVAVNERFETNVPGVYAIGDLIDGPMLAHKASHEGIAFAENLAGKSGHVNYYAIPSVIYTAPELAAVGFTEEQIKERGIESKVGKFPFMANGRAKALDETEGLVKILTDARTDKLLGMHILGTRASEMIAEGVLALEFSASAEDIARTCHAHPTLSEIVGEAAWAAYARALHS